MTYSQMDALPLQSQHLPDASRHHPCAENGSASFPLPSANSWRPAAFTRR